MHYSYYGTPKKGISLGAVGDASLTVEVLDGDDAVVLKKLVVDIHVSTECPFSSYFKMFFVAA